MGSDPWFAEDIRNALLAANEGGNPSLEQVRAVLAQSYWSGGAVERAYREGHKAALTTLALAFGISPAIIDGEQQTEQVVQNSLLEASSPQIEDEHGTLLVERTPTRLGT